MTIGNIGVGLFVLIIIWIVALIIFVIAVRLQSNLGWIALSVAAGITIILSSIPIGNKFETIEEIPEEKDYLLIYKYILLATLSGCACGAFLIFFLTHCIEQIHPKIIESF